VRRKWVVGVIAAGIVAASGCTTTALQYRADPEGSSVFPDTAVSPANVGTLRQKWHFAWPSANCFPSGESRPWGEFATPVIDGDRVFQAYDTGCLAALTVADRTVLWKRDFGFQPPLTCASNPGQGIIATPTITYEKTGDTTTEYLYLHAPNGRLYKLDPGTGNTVWSAAADPPVDPTVNDYYAWSSPLPLPGSNLIVVGLSSNCDLPFQRGGVKAFDRTTGALVWTWWAMPADPNDALRWDVGGGIWTGMAADTHAVYVSTGSETSCASATTTQDKNNPKPVAGVFHGIIHTCDAPGDPYSLVKIDAATGKRLGAFRAPATTTKDPDFGSGTTLFTATIGGVQHRLVGSCNKDGYYYAVDTQPNASGVLPLVWKTLVGTPTAIGEHACLSGAVYDKPTGRLFLAGNVLNGSALSGRVRQVNPATGATIWETPLPSNSLGTGTINGNGVLAYAGMHWENQVDNGIFLLDSKTGKMLDTDPTVAGVQQLKDPYNSSSSCVGCTYDQFAQPVWAANALWMSNRRELSPWVPASS
jgi:hypothetical protein